jgi:hypothetical protein
MPGHDIRSGAGTVITGVVALIVWVLGMAVCVSVYRLMNDTITSEVVE